MPGRLEEADHLERYLKRRRPGCEPLGAGIARLTVRTESIGAIGHAARSVRRSRAMRLRSLEVVAAQMPASWPAMA